MTKTFQLTLFPFAPFEQQNIVFMKLISGLLFLTF